MKKRLLTGLLVFSLVLECGIISLRAEEAVLSTEEMTEETVDTAFEAESAAETEVQITETAAVEEQEAEDQAESELQTEAAALDRVKDDAQMRAFYDDASHSLALVFKPFGEDTVYHYTIFDEDSSVQLQTGDLKVKSFDGLYSAVIKLDEKLFENKTALVRVEISCGDLLAQALVDDSIRNAQEIRPEATADGDIRLQWEEAEADGYVVLALSEDEVKMYESVDEAALEMTSPEAPDVYTVMMAAYEVPEKAAEDAMVVFSPAVTVKVEAADAMLTAEENAETESEAAAEGTETAAAETEEAVLLDAADGEPQAAENLNAKGYESFAKLSWTEGSGTTGNRVWVFDAETGKRIWQSFEGSTSCEVPDLKTDHEYQFQLRAYKVVDGEKVFGASTGKVSFKTAHYVPKAAEKMNVKPGETTAKITWTKGSLAHGYLVWVFDVATGNRVFAAKATGTSCNVSGLKLGREYKYFMRAFRTVGDEEFYGEYTETKRFKTDYIVPDAASGLKAVAGDMSAELSWNKAANATHYLVEMIDSATGKKTAVGRTRSLKYTVEDLKNNKEYSFRVTSYRFVNNHNTYAKATGWVKVKPVMQAPAAPTSLEIVYTDDGNVLTWSEVRNANGYVVYSYNFNTKAYEKVATVTTNTWTDEGNGETGKYRYYVKAFRRENGKTLYGSGISKLVYGNQDLLEAAEIHPILYSGKMNQTTTLYTTQSGSQTAGKVSAGTAVTCSYRTHSGRNRIILSDGSTYWVKPSSVSCYSDHYTSKDYSKAAKETFINKSGYGSSSKYFIWVSTYTQKINIFTGSEGNWKLLLTTPCATGLVATFTPHGKGVLTHHERTFYAEYSYYEWLTYFTSGNAFHTRIKKLSDGSFRSRTLGKPMSGGCVRVKDDIARMIYYDIPLKTGELIY